MALDKIKIDVDFSEIQTMYKRTKETSKERMKKLTTLAARRVPRLVGKRVAERYNISAVEVYPPKYKVKTDRHTKTKYNVVKLSNVRITGETLDTLAFVWEGRRGTVQRFKMKPNAVPKNPREPYDITFSVLRGKTQALKRTDDVRYFVQEVKGVVHAVYASNNRSSALNRKIQGIAKTISVPIMIDNENVQPNVQRDINKLMEDEIRKLK